MAPAPKRSFARTAQLSRASRITPSTAIASAVAVSDHRRSSEATTIVASVMPPMISALHPDVGDVPREHEEEDRRDAHERDADDEQQHRHGEAAARGPRCDDGCDLLRRRRRRIGDGCSRDGCVGDGCVVRRRWRASATGAVSATAASAPVALATAPAATASAIAMLNGTDSGPARTGHARQRGRRVRLIRRDRDSGSPVGGGNALHGCVGSGSARATTAGAGRCASRISSMSCWRSASRLTMLRPSSSRRTARGSATTRPQCEQVGPVRRWKHPGHSLVSTARKVNPATSPCRRLNQTSALLMSCGVS